jgi:hypothetical protein
MEEGIKLVNVKMMEEADHAHVGHRRDDLRKAEGVRGENAEAELHAHPTESRGLRDYAIEGVYDGDGEDSNFSCFFRVWRGNAVRRKTDSGKVLYYLCQGLLFFEKINPVFCFSTIPEVTKRFQGGRREGRLQVLGHVPRMCLLQGRSNQISDHV